LGRVGSLTRSIYGTQTANARKEKAPSRKIRLAIQKERPARFFRQNAGETESRDDADLVPRRRLGFVMSELTGRIVRRLKREFKWFSLAASIPEISLDTILGPAKAEIHLTIQRYEDGMLPTHQAIALLTVAVTSAPKVVLEIGTFMGHTTRQFAANLPGAIIHTVDLPLDFSPNQDPGQLEKDDAHLIAKREVGREFRRTLYEARIRQHLVDTATWDFKDAAGATLFFIDGSHTYDYCKHDSERCYELCQGKGVFLWHDCDETHPGVAKVLLEWRKLGRDVRRIKGTPIAYWKSSE
jgi:hypothetical protein